MYILATLHPVSLQAPPPPLSSGSNNNQAHQRRTNNHPQNNIQPSRINTVIPRFQARGHVLVPTLSVEDQDGTLKDEETSDD